jgi:uncharacterized membrane protein (DUF485 family)
VSPSVTPISVDERSPGEERPGGSHADLLDAPEFHRLVARRWRASLLLTTILFVVYYGYILLVATNKPLLSTRIGSGTLGILLGVAVILISWALTAVYVVWANWKYDPEVRRLRERLR